jgi:hypothetical protein
MWWTAMADGGALVAGLAAGGLLAALGKRLLDRAAAYAIATSRSDFETARVAWSSPAVVLIVALVATAGVAVARGGPGEPPRLPDRTGSVLFIGIDLPYPPATDARPWATLDDAKQRAVLDALSEHRMPIPPGDSVPARWASILTGKPPAVHGVHGATSSSIAGGAQVDPSFGSALDLVISSILAPAGFVDERPMASSTRQACAPWDICHLQRGTSIVAGWWGTSPPPPLKGFVISDHAFAAAWEDFTTVHPLPRYLHSEVHPSAAAAQLPSFSRKSRIGFPWDEQVPFLGDGTKRLWNAVGDVHLVTVYLKALDHASDDRAGVWYSVAQLVATATSRGAQVVLVGQPGLRAQPGDTMAVWTTLAVPPVKWDQIAGALSKAGGGPDPADPATLLPLPSEIYPAHNAIRDPAFERALLDELRTMGYTGNGSRVGASPDEGN